MRNSVGSEVVQWRDEKTAAKKRVERGVIPYLPDDIIINIVTRLPADDVLRCRCVCRVWRDLTSTQVFVEIHRSRQVISPSILVDSFNLQHPEIRCSLCNNPFFRERYFIESWWEPTEKRLKRPGVRVFGNFSNYSLVISLGGLILFKEHNCLQLHQWIILNPTNGESLTIKFLGDTLDTWKWYEVYGIFFHPVLKEYCTLWGLSKYLLSNERGRTLLAKFKLLVMGSIPYSRDIRDALGGKEMASFTNPLLMNEHLYWLADSKLDKRPYDIIEFDLKSEEFVVIPSPATSEVGTGLLNIDGLVSVVTISLKSELVTIWTLKDRPGKLWTSSSYSISNEGCTVIWSPLIQPIALAEGELVFHCSRTMFFCNLKSKPPRSLQEVNLNGQCFFHVTTVASFRKCRSHIEARETRKERSGGGIQIIWEQLNTTQAQKNSVSHTDNDKDSA